MTHEMVHILILFSKFLLFLYNSLLTLSFSVTSVIPLHRSILDAAAAVSYRYLWYPRKDVVMLSWSLRAPLNKRVGASVLIMALVMAHCWIHKPMRLSTAR